MPQASSGEFLSLNKCIQIYTKLHETGRIAPHGAAYHRLQQLLLLRATARDAWRFQKA